MYKKCNKVVQTYVGVYNIMLKKLVNLLVLFKNKNQHYRFIKDKFNNSREI